MRKTVFLLMLCACLALLPGCSSLNQIEKLAFAEVLGVDLNDTGEIEVCIEVPKITGQQGEGAPGGDGSQLVYSATGRNFDEALNLLQWAVPRRLDLSQIKLIVVSEALARDEQFLKVAGTIMATPRLYTAARLAVSKGSAKDFINAEKPIIGTRLSTELTATFEDYIRNGYIPDTNFADFFLESQSVYSDALVIYAETSESPSKEPSSAAKPAAAILPEESMLSTAETQHSNRYLGAAVFQNGKMIGKLSSEDFLYCKILNGKQQAFPFSIDNHTIGLTTLGQPGISMDLTCNPIQLEIDLRFSIVSSSKSVAIPNLESALESSTRNAIESCRSMGAEPLGLAKHAAGRFFTIEDWTDFDWRSHFLQSKLKINITVHDTKT